MARAGCIAVTGGLETVCDRTLRLMQKGVTVEQAAQVTKRFADAGIMVHAYLMYGFPTQTAQETIDALERVRQLFAAGCIQSAYWHRFALTVHSPMARDPKRFGIRLLPMPRATFARNEIFFEGISAGWRSETAAATSAPACARRSTTTCTGRGWIMDVRAWFDFKVPRARVTTPSRSPASCRRRTETGR